MSTVEPLAYGSYDEHLLFDILGHELESTYGIDLLSVDGKGHPDEDEFMCFSIRTESSLDHIVKKQFWCLRRSDGFDKILKRVMGDIVMNDYRDAVKVKAYWHADKLMEYALGLDSYEEYCSRDE